ncbi:MAG TPA: extracellular solute-binding protein [Methylomirabilota bacterium]|nr:extracellular solute-binding protein [Methylomirabilota bacterium]
MWRTRLALAVLAAVLAAGAARAQDARVAEARREGKVVWHTALALDSAQGIATRFEKAYPGLRVEVHRSGSERILQRLMQELAAGIKNADVVNTSDTGHYVFLKRKGLLARYTPAGADRLPPAFRDADAMAWGWRAFPLVIPYNTRLVAAADAPRTWKDLLDPKWKGRLVIAHPSYAGSVVTQVIALANLHGWEFWTQLARNRPMLVQSIHDPGRTVASGERAAGANGADYGFLYNERRKGSPIAAAYPSDGVLLIFSPTAITSFAPHPGAARLFTDFVFTREIQQVLADTEGLYVAHPDVTYPPDRPKLADLKVLVVDPEEIERRVEEVKKRFVELFGA